MKLKFSTFKGNEEFVYDFKSQKLNELNHSKDIISFNDASINICSNKVGEILTLNISGKVNLTLKSAYTFKPFEDEISIEEELIYTNNPDYETEEVFYTKEDIDLDEIIYSLTVVSLPTNPHKKGESTDTIEGIKILKEEDLEKESSPFDILSGIDFDS